MWEIGLTIGFANIVIIIISIRTNLIVQCSLSFTTKHYSNFSQWLFSFSPWYHRSPLISQVAAILLSRQAASQPNCGTSSPPCLIFQLISFTLGFGRLGKFTIINWMFHLHLFGQLFVDSCVIPIRTSHEELLLANKLAPLRAAGLPIYNNKWSFQLSQPSSSQLHLWQRWYFAHILLTKYFRQRRGGVALGWLEKSPWFHK